MPGPPRRPLPRRLAAALVIVATAFAGSAILARGRRALRTHPVPVAAPGAPLVTRVEHVVTSTRDAEAIYHLLRDTLGLPQVWPYRRWGGFASGGVTLGNVVLELASGSRAPARATFTGLALEPGGTTDALLAGLAARDIAHGRPDSARSTSLFGGPSGWVTTSLPALAAWGVFACDYLRRAEVAAGRRRAADALGARAGGALGVRALREIVLETPDVGGARRAWLALAYGVASPPDSAVIAFAQGPRIRLVRADAPAIAELVVEVRSLDAARRALARMRMLGANDARRVTLDPARVRGLRVVLVGR